MKLYLVGIFWLISSNLSGFAQELSTDIYNLEIGETVALLERNNGDTFNYEDVKIKFEVTELSVEENSYTATITIERPALENPVILTADTDFGFVGSLGVFNMDKNGSQTILFQVFSGGVHCCVFVWAINIQNNQIEQEFLGSYDGYQELPRDIDNDGFVEFAIRDRAFNYAFDSYAASAPYAPPIIFSSSSGKVYDASSETRFEAFFSQLYLEFLPECMDLENFGDIYAGPCAGFLGIAARLGKYQETKSLVSNEIERVGEPLSTWSEYTFCVGKDCEPKVIFKEFLPAVEYALGVWGYLPSDDLSN